MSKQGAARVWIILRLATLIILPWRPPMARHPRQKKMCYVQGTKPRLMEQRKKRILILLRVSSAALIHSDQAMRPAPNSKKRVVVLRLMVEGAVDLTTL